MSWIEPIRTRARDWSDSLTAWFDRMFSRARTERSPLPAASGRLAWLAALPVAALFIYFVLGGLLIHKVDTDLAFRPGPADLPPGGSVAVGMASAVLNREVRDHHWTPDDPWFYPTLLLDNMPNFQRGIRYTVLQFTLELKDQVARLRGSGGTDSDLESAFADLSYPPNRWWVGAPWPWVRQSSRSSYLDGVDELRAFNQRLGAGRALYERRADSLDALLNRMALNLGAASAALDQHVSAHRGEWFDNKADDIFYDTQGRAYASYLILAGLRQDYADLIRQRQIGNIWAEMMSNLEEVAAVRPLVVMNGERGGFLVNHLSEQGFALERARNRLREINAILQK